MPGSEYLGGYPPGNTTPDWVGLFKSREGSNRNLKPADPKQPSTPLGVAFDIARDELDSSAIKWKNALVGYLIGKKPPYEFVKESLRKAWRT